MNSDQFECHHCEGRGLLADGSKCVRCGGTGNLLLYRLDGLILVGKGIMNCLGAAATAMEEAAHHVGEMRK